MAPAKTVFFECDMQQALFPYLYNAETLEHNGVRLTQTSQILDIPVIATTQVRGGKISDKITAKHHAGVRVFEGKFQFSMMTPELDAHFKSLARDTVVLYGAEAHICILQTALDLIERGINVFVVVDACTSMQVQDRNVSLAAMQAAGVHLTTFQAVVFELVRGVDHKKFKQFLPLLKASADPKKPLDLASQPKL